MEIKESKNKVKIIIEYLKKGINFAQIVGKDLDKVYVKIFLEDGEVVLGDYIKSISISKRDTFPEKSEQGDKSGK